jgi:hypothetical protein
MDDVITLLYGTFFIITISDQKSVFSFANQLDAGIEMKVDVSSCKSECY